LIEINPGLQCLLQTSISLKEQSQILNQLSDWFLRGYTAWRLSEIGGSDCHLPQALTTLIFDYDFGSQSALKLSQEEICIESLAWKTLGSSLVPHLQSVIAHCNKFEISVLKLQPLPAEFAAMAAKPSRLKHNCVSNETIPRLARSGFVASSGDDPGDEPGKGSTTCCVDDDRTRDVLQIARIGRNRYGFVNSRLSKQKAHEISSAPSKVLAKQGNLNFLSDAPGLQTSGLGC